MNRDVGKLCYCSPDCGLYDMSACILYVKCHRATCIVVWSLMNVIFLVNDNPIGLSVEAELMATSLYTELELNLECSDIWYYIAVQFCGYISEEHGNFDHAAVRRRFLG